MTNSQQSTDDDKDIMKHLLPLHDRITRVETIQNHHGDLISKIGLKLDDQAKHIEHLLSRHEERQEKAFADVTCKIESIEASTTDISGSIMNLKYWIGGASFIIIGIFAALSWFIGNYSGIVAIVNGF